MSVLLACGLPSCARHVILFLGLPMHLPPLTRLGCGCGPVLAASLPLCCEAPASLAARPAAQPSPAPPASAPAPAVKFRHLFPPLAAIHQSRRQGDQPHPPTKPTPRHPHTSPYPPTSLPLHA